MPGDVLLCEHIQKNLNITKLMIFFFTVTHNFQFLEATFHLNYNF